MSLVMKGSGKIVEQLNQKQKGRWKAVRDGFGWYWENDQGRTVRAYSQLNNQYDGDESWHSVYIDDKGVQVGSCGLIYRD